MEINMNLNKQYEKIYTAIKLPVLFAGLAILSLMLFGCSTSAEQSLIIENDYAGSLQDSDSFHLKIEELVSFGREDGTDDEMISDVSHLTEDDDGNVYLLDRDRIKSFDDSGNLRWAVGETGRGPGELTRPSSIYFDGVDRLIVGNQGFTRLDEFALDGTFLKSTVYGDIGHSRLSLSGFVNDSILVTQDQKMLGGYIVSGVFLNARRGWEAVGEYAIDQTEGEHSPLFVPMVPGSVRATREGIGMPHTLRYEWTVRTMESDTLSVMRRKVDLYRKSGSATDGTGGTGFNFSMISPPVEFAGGYRMILGSWPREPFDPDEYVARYYGGPIPYVEKTRSLDIYDADWHLLYSYENEAIDELAIGSPLGRSRDGNVYAFQTSPYPRVVKLSIRVVK